MQITKIHIEHFGKIANLTLTLNRHQNIIYGGNEQGKSTIMAFIRTMLYGFSRSGSKDLLKNARKKYTPWTGEDMCGYLEMESDGSIYRIERRFGGTARKDTLKIVNQSTNQLEELSSKDEPGRIFLNMSEESFERSVFIGQIGSIINAENSKEDEIIGKLQNLASTGHETQSYNQVALRLQTTIEKIKSRSGKIGEFEKIVKAKELLDEDKYQAIAQESEKMLVQNEIQELAEEKLALETQIATLTTHINQRKLFETFNEKERILEKNRELTNLEEEVNALKKTIETDGKAITLSDIESSKEKLQELNTERSILEEKTTAIKTATEELESLQYQNNLIIPDVDYSEATSLFEQIKDNQKNVTQLEEIVEETNRLEIKAQEYRKRIDELIDRKDVLISTLSQKKRVNSSTHTFTLTYIIALVLFILGVFGGWLLHPSLYIIIGISMLMIVYQLITQRRTDSRYIHYEEQNQKSGMEEIQRIEEDERFANTELAEIKEKVQSFNEIQLQIQTITAKNKDQVHAFQDILERYQSKSIEDLKILYIKSEDISRRQGMIRESIQQQNESVDALTAEHTKNVQAFISVYGSRFGFDDLDSSSEVIHRITDSFYQYQSVRQIIQEKQRDLRYALNGQTLAEVLADHNQLDEQLKHMDVIIDENTDLILHEQRKQNYLSNQLKEIELKIVELQTQMTHRFVGVSEVSEIDIRIEENIRRQEYYIREHEALIKAKDVMEQAFNQMQQSFGPVVNRKCSEIFSKLTGSKYNEIMVARDLNMSVWDPILHSTYDWKYLSNGTIDQLYFSLRLAISEIFSEKVKGLPVFLDDAFLQYDDERTENAMAFLKNYTKIRDVQILLFTCRRTFLDIAAEDTHIISLFSNNT